MAEEHDGLRGPNARGRELGHRPPAVRPLPPPAPYRGRYPQRVPFDRTDRRNLRYRRRAPLRPLVLALITWLLIMALVAIPAASLFWYLGGVPPDGWATDAEYWNWSGSPEKGRSAAIATLVVIGAVATVSAGWVLHRRAKDRRDTLGIDTMRMRRGVRAVTVPEELDQGHDWFGRRRRRAITETPMPRADRGTDHAPH